MKWVLIVWMTTGGGGAAIDHVPFDTEVKCVAALKAALEEKAWALSMHGVCVPNEDRP